MLTRENDIDINTLDRQGWTISAIARHLGRDRKTIRAYLAGREAGVRQRSDPDPFEPYAAYCAQRLHDDPHLWGSTLFDELLELGYRQSYPTMTRQIRARGLRPACEPCRPTKGRAIAVIEHPPGQETQWDWVVPALAGQPQRCRGEGQSCCRATVLTHPADDVTVEQAQARLDVLCATPGDARLRATLEGRFTVAQLAAGEVLGDERDCPGSFGLRPRV